MARLLCSQTPLKHKCIRLHTGSIDVRS